MNLSRIDVVYVEFDVTATTAAGEPTTVSGVDVALLPPRTAPTAATTWTPAAYTAGVATVLLAGPDADDPGDALSVPASDADLWARITDIPEVQATKVARVSIT